MEQHWKESVVQENTNFLTATNINLLAICFGLRIVIKP